MTNAAFDMNEIDWATAQMSDLDDLTLDDVLGENLADIELSSNLPDCVVLVHFDKTELKRRAADIDNNKKAGLTLMAVLKVVQCISCADSSTDPETLAGRSHIQNFSMSHTMGKQQLVKLVLSALGISWKDKASIAEVGENLAELVAAMVADKLVFGVKIVNKTSGQYENCDIVFKEDAIISIEAAGAMLDG